MASVKPLVALAAAVAVIISPSFRGEGSTSKRVCSFRSTPTAHVPNAPLSVFHLVAIHGARILYVTPPQRRSLSISLGDHNTRQP